MSYLKYVMAIILEKYDTLWSDLDFTNSIGSLS
jgi:hypothetical protein